VVKVGNNGLAAYKVWLEISDDEMVQFKDLELVSGMPVEVFFKTKERTVISYLLKPLSDQIQRSLIEE